MKHVHFRLHQPKQSNWGLNLWKFQSCLPWNQTELDHLKIQMLKFSIFLFLNFVKFSAPRRDSRLFSFGNCNCKYKFAMYWWYQIQLAIGALNNLQLFFNKSFFTDQWSETRLTFSIIFLTNRAVPLMSKT